MEKYKDFELIGQSCNCKGLGLVLVPSREEILKSMPIIVGKSSIARGLDADFSPHLSKSALRAISF
jgi:hypothetical protein